MKNYILFSTNEPKAIDNTSMVVLCEETLDVNKAINMLAKECKYSHFQVVPVGEPLGTAFNMNQALTTIRSLKLHKVTRVIDEKKIDIVMSITTFADVSVTTEDGKVILATKMDYQNGNPALLCKEHSIVTRLLELFGNRHLAYHRTRNVFELVPSDTEDIGIDWALVKGDVVQITKKYSYIEVEL